MDAIGQVLAAAWELAPHLFDLDKHSVDAKSQPNPRTGEIQSPTGAVSIQSQQPNDQQIQTGDAIFNGSQKSSIGTAKSKESHTPMASLSLRGREIARLMEKKKKRRTNKPVKSEDDNENNDNHEVIDLALWKEICKA